MSVDTFKLSKAVSHALRHEPQLYNLELDVQGWVEIDSLIQSLRGKDLSWSALSRTDLEKMIELSTKKRHEIKGNKIRALYGHSLATKITQNEVVPPEFLFHGTSLEACKSILEDGLKPMKRQYVHLSSNEETAITVGLRKTGDPVLLRIAAKNAHVSGIRFYQGNEKVFLSEEIPCEYIEINTQ
mgnify:CR=1 FL=1